MKEAPRVYLGATSLVTHRVLLVMPRLPRDIFKKLLGDGAGIELVGELDSADDLAATVHETHADFVIIDCDEGTLRVAEFLRRYSRLKILAVEAAGDSASVYEFLPHRSYVGELTRETVLHAFEDRQA